MLDSIPELMLKQIIELLPPRELIDLRFLNKHCYPVVNQVFYENLVMSKYFNEVYREYQMKFYSKYGNKVKHLRFTHFFYSLPSTIKQCPNIVSLVIKDFDPFQFEDLILISSENAPSLTKLSIEFDGDLPSQLPNLPLLDNIIEFQLKVKRFYPSHLTYLLNNLNENRLISLEINCSQYMELGNLDIFNLKFINLEKLSLDAWQLCFPSFPNNLYAFHRLLHFELVATLTYDLDALSLFYNYLTQLSNLKSLIFNYCNLNQCSKLHLKSAINPQLESLMLSGCTKIIFNNFKDIKELSLNCYKNLTYLMELMANLKRLKTLKLYWYSESKEVDFEQFSKQKIYFNIERIEFYQSHITADHLFTFLKLFPKLKYLDFNKGRLSPGQLYSSFKYLNDIQPLVLRINESSYLSSNPFFHEISNHPNILFFNM